MSWLSIDPGQVHVGMAEWQKHCLIAAWETSPDDLLSQLDMYQPNKVVIESFSLLSPKYNKHAAKQAVDTIELIGMVRGYCWYHEVSVVKQAPALRHIATKNPAWVRVYHESDLTFSRGNDHIRSAIAHGMYHLLFTEEVTL